MTEPNQAMKTHQLEIDFFSSLTLLFIIIIAPNFFLEWDKAKPTSGLNLECLWAYNFKGDNDDATNVRDL